MITLEILKEHLLNMDKELEAIQKRLINHLNVTEHKEQIREIAGMVRELRLGDMFEKADVSN